MTCDWNPSSRYQIGTPLPGSGWPVPENASQRLYISLFQSPSAITFEPMCCAHGRSLGFDGYGWKETVSRIGAVRPLARYASPTFRMKLPGDCEPASSLPLDDSARPVTFTVGNAACSAS